MNFVAVLFYAVNLILSVIEWIVFAWVILSWILFFTRQSKFRWRNRGFYSALEQLDDILGRMVRPFLRPFRRMMRNVNTGGIDWSPLLLILAILILRRLLQAAAASILVR